MKDLDKNPADAAKAPETETKFDIDATLVDEPVLEKDYFTFNIQDIIKAVNEHEAAEFETETGPEPEPAAELEPEPVDNQESKSTDEIAPVDNQEPEVESGSKSADDEPEQGETEPVEVVPEEPVSEESQEVESDSEEVPVINTEQEPVDNADPESTSEFDSDDNNEFEPINEPDVETEPEQKEPDSETQPASEPEQEPDPEEVPVTGKTEKTKWNDKSTKKLVIADIILLVVIIASIAGGLVFANSLVNKANAAKEEKIAAVQENIKEVDLTESLREYAADEVLEQIKVPTYTLEQLYALDLREKTGFTEEDLKIITTRGLVGCEKAFVEAEEKYGVNSIFLVSIASLESAYGTQMFRPNNMFGYGRTGFSSKSECIMTVAKGLGTRYLQPGASLYGGSPTLKGVNKRYAANPQWYYKVGKYMQRYYNELAAAKNGNVEKFE